jgi:succinoglycan biosynthesis protein ExoA
MKTAVVIPCRNEARSIRALLDALAAQTVLPTEIVIADDTSTDESVALIQQWQHGHPDVPLRIVASPRRGAGAAMNAGIAATATEAIVRLDAHSVPDSDYVEHSVGALDTPGVGVAGGYWRVRPGAETPIARAIALVVSHPLGSGGARYRHPAANGPVSQSVDTVPFGAFRRSLWEQLGGFDEALSANQDFDFNYRARVAGFEVVIDRRINAAYVARPTLSALWRQYVRYGFWKRQMLRKDARALRWRQLPPVLLLPWLLVSTAQVAIWPSGATVAAAGLYPLVLLLGAAHLALRGAKPMAAFAALATVHLGWSAGFWRGLLGGTPPGR